MKNITINIDADISWQLQTEVDKQPSDDELKDKLAQLVKKAIEAEKVTINNISVDVKEDG